MKRHYEAVQVIDKYPNGTCKTWYAGTQFPTLEEAREEAKKLSTEFPDTPYQIIEVKTTDIGLPYIGKVKSTREKESITNA